VNGDRFPPPIPDSALEINQANFPFYGPQYEFMHVLPRLSLHYGQQTTQSVGCIYEDIDPMLQKDVIGGSYSNKLAHSDLEAQSFVQSSQVYSYSPVESNIPSEADYGPSVALQHLEYNMPSLYCQAPGLCTQSGDQDLRADQLSFGHSATPLTPVKRQFHYPPEVVPQERNKVTSIIDNRTLNLRYTFDNFPDACPLDPLEPIHPEPFTPVTPLPKTSTLDFHRSILDTSC
jgi:hypothetical protein